MALQEQLKTKYLDWLNQKLTIKDMNGVIQITSPLTDRNRDRLKIYVIPEGNRLKLSDDGFIIDDL